MGCCATCSELDHGDGPVERVIRLDELRVEVYGESPNRSKQIILAWRDTTFLPNRMDYHRDHLGIVANDFGPTIRLGQGEEVRDVPHPLSDAGLSAYQFAVGDTLVLTTREGPGAGGGDSGPAQSSRFGRHGRDTLPRPRSGRARAFPIHVHSRIVSRSDRANDHGRRSTTRCNRTRAGCRGVSRS